MIKKLLSFFLLTAVLTGFGLAFWRGLLPWLQPSTGQLSVSTPQQNATVFLDGKELGKTPFYSKVLKVGDHNLTIESDGVSWKTKTTLTEGTFNTLDLNLSRIDRFTSGENLFFRTGQKSLTVLSKPEGAKVFLNNQEKGSTPLKLTPDNGVVTLTLKKEGYLSREITPNLVENYRLTANIFLAVDPFGTIKKLDSNPKATLFSIYNQSIDLSRSYSDWVEGLKFTQKQFTGAQTRFDLLLDPTGNTYVLNETEWKNKLATKAVANIGYLATKANDSLSDKANATWQTLKIQFN